MLDRARPARKFRRMHGAALTTLLPRPTGVTGTATPGPNESGSIDLDATEDPEEGSPS